MAQRYPWYALSVMLVAYVLAFVDRQMVNLLVEPIKHDLSLSDTRISLLQGFSFALTLSLAALPIGRLIDTGRRTLILSAGVVVWSVMTAGCAAATTFSALLFARAGVAAGEATMTPVALSMIGDYFPPRRIGLATGIYALGVHLGSGLALILGALLVEFAKSAVVSVPGLGTIQGWRLVFLSVGLPGLLVALWVAHLREPPRGGSEHHPHSVIPWREALAFLRAQGRAQGSANLAVGFALMANYGVSAWAPAFFSRSYGWGPSSFGTTYGPLTIISGVSGVLIAAVLGDRWHGRGLRDARLRILGGATLIAAPLYAVAPLIHDPIATLSMLAFANFFNAAAIGSGPGILQDIAPPRLRGMTHALALLTVNLIALGLGPTSIAAFTDYAMHDEQKLGLSLAIVPPIVLLISAVFARAGRAAFHGAIQLRGQQGVT
jgi:MFS family permease